MLIRFMALGLIRKRSFDIRSPTPTSIVFFSLPNSLYSTSIAAFPKSFSSSSTEENSSEPGRQSKSASDLDDDAAPNDK
jgi:hypothetical protein